jgi:hypothetical protein
MKHRPGHRGGIGQDHVRSRIHDLSCELRDRFSSRCKPAMLEPDVLAFRPPELEKPFAERRNPSRSFRVVFCVWHHHADAAHLVRLLRGCFERPPSSRAADELDELPSSYSITSSARAMTVAGISRPSAFAVFRLMANSKVTGCAMGRSPGLVPLRILSV